MRSDEALPDAVRRLADRIVARDRHASVYLFGSRAMGCARPDSDWDLAAVATAGSVRCARKEIGGGGPLIDLWRLDPATFEARSQLLGTLEREVCCTGALVAGAERDNQATPHEGTEPGARTRLLQSCAENLALAINALALKRVNPLTYPRAGKYSADGAEAAVKLACLAFGKPYSTTHSVEALCDDLPDPAWSDRLRRLNGRTTALHVQGYKGIAEDEGDTIRRVELTVEALRDLAVLFAPALPATEALRVRPVLDLAIGQVRLPGTDGMSDLRDLSDGLEEAAVEWLRLTPTE